MGENSTIPILQMIFALLALSECLPISGGGSPGTLPHQPSSHAAREKWNQKKHNDFDKVWIPISSSDTVQHTVRQLRASELISGGVKKNSNKKTLKEHWEMPSVSREFNFENSNSKHKAKLKSKSKEMLAVREGSVSAENVTIIIKKNKLNREKRSYIVMHNHLDPSIISNLTNEVVDIAYTHVVPCAFRDRYYCLNGGTCLFVEALEIKTCRCPSGYTGLRCESIHHEYLLALLSKVIGFN